MKNLKLAIYFILPLLLLFNACSTNNQELLNSENSILEFTVDNKKATINEDEKTINLELGYETDLTKVKPIVKISNNATVTPASRAEVNFTEPVTYKVVAENGESKSYTATATKEKSPVAKITSFTFSIGETKIEAIIDEENKKVTAATPFGTDLSKVIPTVAFTGASINLEDGKAIDLTKELEVIVTAEAGNEVSYTINITVAASDAANILTFAFNTLTPKVVATIEGTTITATVPFETEWTKLVPTITIEGKELSPKSEVAQDFSNDVTYTVTADNGDKVPYTVKVTRTTSSEVELLKFAFNALTPKVEGVLSSDKKTVTVDLPYETNVTKLVPTIEFKGHVVAPESGRPQDYTMPVNYKITAQDGITTHDFKVVVNVAVFEPAIEKIDKIKVIRGSIITITGKFADKGNSAELVHDKTLKSQLEIISENATTIKAKIGDLAKLDYHNVRVKSHGATVDSKEQIQVLADHQMAAKVTDFRFSGLNCNLYMHSDLGDIFVEIPYGTSTTNLTAAVKHDAVSVAPSFESVKDYSTPAKFTLTSEEGVKKEFTVTVTVGKFPTKITGLSPAMITQRSLLQIEGAFLPGGNKIRFKEATTGKEYKNISTTSETATSLSIQLTESMLPVGFYNIFVAANDGGSEAEFNGMLHISEAFNPSIANVSTTTPKQGSNLTVYGRFATTAPNQLFLMDATGKETELSISSQSWSQLDTKIPEALTPQTYTLVVISDGGRAEYSNKITVAAK